MAVTVKNLTKSFGKRRLFTIDALTLDNGITCIGGQSGCGKTTFGRILAGLEGYDSGELTGIGKHPAILFQESRLLPSLSALKNVETVCREDSFKTLSKELLSELLFTEEDMKKTPKELSGGMIRRVAIVRAIVFALENQSEFVLLDEPFTGLDDGTREIAANIIKRTLNDRTVLVITHDKAECELLSANYLSFSEISY